MDMAPINCPDLDHHSLASSDFSQQLASSQTNIPSKHLIPVFSRPHDVVLQIPGWYANRVCSSSFQQTTHYTPTQYCPPPKDMGITDPLSWTLKRTRAAFSAQQEIWLINPPQSVIVGTRAWHPARPQRMHAPDPGSRSTCNEPMKTAFTVERKSTGENC